MTHGKDNLPSGSAHDRATDRGEILDFASNITPCPVSDTVKQALADVAGGLDVYPDSAVMRLREIAADHFGVSSDEVLPGCGATEFIFAVPRRLRPRRVVVVAPCYHDYWRAIEHAGAEAEGVLATEADEFIPDPSEIELRLSGADMAFLGNPNNPTGVAIPASAIRDLASKFPSVQFLVDESYVEFVPESAGVALLVEPLPDNVIVLRSLSAFHGMAGLRLGFMVASADLCTYVQRAREPWTVSSCAAAVGEALLTDEQDAAAVRQPVIAERERVRDELSRMAGLRVFQSQANFLLIKITRPGLSSTALCKRMLSQNMRIRNAAGVRGLDNRFVTVAVRTAEDNKRLIEGFTAALDSSRWK